MKHVHSFGPRGRGQCSCGMLPGEPVRTVEHFRQRVKEGKVMLEMLELHLEYAGHRDAAKRAYDARLRLSEVDAALPGGDADG